MFQQPQHEAGRTKLTRTERLAQRMSRLLSRPHALQAPVHDQNVLVIGLARAGKAISRTGTQIAEVARSFHPSAPRNRLQRNPASQSPSTNIDVAYALPHRTPDPVPLRDPAELLGPLNPTPSGQDRDRAFRDMYHAEHPGIQEVQEAELLEEAGLNGMNRGPRSYNRRLSGYEF